MNKHHSGALKSFVETFSQLGVEQIRKNSFSGGSFSIESAKLLNIDKNFLYLDSAIKIRGKTELHHETVKISLDAKPTAPMLRTHPDLPVISSDMEETVHPVDNFVRRCCRLCIIANHESMTGKLLQLGTQIGGQGVGILKENLYLNQVPHNRYVRKYFYEMVSKAVLDAVQLCSEGKIGNRMKTTIMFPEMNPSMDSYRIGTLLEAVRCIAITLAEQNLRVRVCVQGSMGVGIFTGLPKQLSGVSALLSRMDWQSNEGEENEGMIGNFVNFGAIGAEHVVNGGGTDTNGNEIHQDDVFLLICPQSMVGLESSIYEPLSDMVRAAGDRPIILINPDLTDKVSSQGQQSIRGRQERIDFSNSFETVFHFQNIYYSGTSYFPILGAISKFGPTSAWVAYQRRDRLDGKSEVYVPTLLSESQPDGESVLNTFES